MLKKIATLVLSAFLITSIAVPVFAQADYMESENTEESDSMDAEKMDSENIMEEIDSFELFWPVVAGKTREDSLYFLKKMKERIRGWVIFGDAKDAEYNLELATKRVVEAEQLINDDKHDLAAKTLDDAKERVEAAADEWEDVDNKETNLKHEINNKLNNLDKFLPYLKTKSENDDVSAKLDSLIQEVSSLNSSI